MSKETSQPKLIWERLKESGRGQTGLSREQIVRAAITLADSEGLGQLTIRRIATVLDAGTMSLYRHVANKDDLLDLMLDTAFGEIELPEQPTGNWHADLRQFAYSTRRIFLQHPWLSVLLVSRPTLGPNYLRWFEFSLASLAYLKLDTTTMFHAISTVNGFVTAAAGYESAETEHNRSLGLSEEDKRAIATPYVETVIASGRFPNFASFFNERIVPDLEASFAFGLDCILDGLAARFTQHLPQTSLQQTPDPNVVSTSLASE